MLSLFKKEKGMDDELRKLLNSFFETFVCLFGMLSQNDLYLTYLDPRLQKIQNE